MSATRPSRPRPKPPFTPPLGHARSRFACATCLALVLLFVPATALAQPRPTRVILAPAALELSGGPASVSVLVDGAPSLSRVALDVSWDAELFALTAVTPGDGLVLEGQDEPAKSESGILHYDYDLDAGRLRLAATLDQGGGDEQDDASAAPPEAPPVAGGGLDEGGLELSLVTLDFAALAEGETSLQILPEESELLDAEGAPIEVAAFEEGGLRASLPPDPATVDEALAAAEQVGALGGGLSGGGLSGGGLSVIGEAARRVGGDVAALLAGEESEGGPKMLWLGALLGGLLLAWAGWAIGREPEGKDPAEGRPEAAAHTRR